MLKWRSGGLLLMGLLLLSPAALALSPALFGAEFTFYNQTGDWTEIRDRMVLHLLENQPQGAKFGFDLTEDLHRHKFTSPNGWWFTITSDLGVAEVQTIPATVDYYRQFERDMQDAIFASASNVGFFPGAYIGGGHINIGLKEIAERPLLLRNFIVDLLNHNELFLGIFNYDTNNALSFSLYSHEAQAQIRRVIAQYDRGELHSYHFLLTAIQAAQKCMTDPFQDAWDHQLLRGKSFAINLTHAIDGASRRIEIRGVRPQASMDVFVRQIELFQRRLEYLDTISEPIPLQPLVPIQKIDLEEHKLNPPVSPQLALRAFYKYVSESGLSWKDHRDYLWPNWIAGGELEKFESSGWFQRRESQSACERALRTGS